jgi:hypothetical protein
MVETIADLRAPRLKQFQGDYSGGSAASLTKELRGNQFRRIGLRNALPRNSICRAIDDLSQIDVFPVK